MYAERRAFTLIELVAVIAVMVLILSFLMPAFSMTRQQAETTVCLGGKTDSV